MLELYHHGTSVCAAKARIALAEKGLEWQGRYIDILKGEQFAPDYLKLNPKHVVPTLVHDGRIIRESTLIGEYLDETFPDPPLQPRADRERQEMRDWLRTATDIHVPAVKTLIYTRKIGKVLHKNQADDVKYHSLQRDPELLAFHSRASTGIGLPKEQVERAEETLLRLFDKADNALAQHRWLVGDRFSLADISWVPLHFTLIGVDFPFHRYPHVSAWADAIRERSSFQEGVLRWCAKF